MIMTEEKESEFKRKIDYVVDMIREIEKKIGRKVFTSPCITADNEQYFASFQGIGMHFYDIPYEVFMALTPQELVIEIMRALTIEFNEYENE